MSRDWRSRTCCGHAHCTRRRRAATSWRLARGSFAAAGLGAAFVQDNQSGSHWARCAVCTTRSSVHRGSWSVSSRREIFDVAVDLRAEFGHRSADGLGAMLSAENRQQLYVPPGFAHGFLVSELSAEVVYKCTDFYFPEHERTLLGTMTHRHRRGRCRGQASRRCRPRIGAEQAPPRNRDLRVRVLLTGRPASSARRCGDGAVCVKVVALVDRELDIATPSRVARRWHACVRTCVINAAAYTRGGPGGARQSLAFEVNAVAPRGLAEAAAPGRCPADPRFDRLRVRRRSAAPYDVGAETGPLSVYGRSKLCGGTGRHSRARNRGNRREDVWLYGSPGKQFCADDDSTAAEPRISRRRLRPGRISDVVEFTGGARSGTLARRPNVNGIQHWSDHGVASWYDFAVAIQEEAIDRGLLLGRCPSGRFARPVSDARPSAGYSVLDKRTQSRPGREPAHWRTNLRRMLDELAGA